MQKESKPLNLRLILVSGTAFLLIVVQALGLFSNLTTPIERLEYSMQDTFVRLRGVDEVSDDIVIVAIDDASFQWNGLQWPWPRSYFAEIADQINAGGGKVLGMDVLLFEPDDNDPQNDAVFASALSEIPATVGVIEIRKQSGAGFESEVLAQPLPIYLESMDGVGITAVKRDDDAIVRSVVAYSTYQGDVYPHWAFELARLYLNVDPPTFNTTGVVFNGQSVPLNAGYLPIYFAGPAGTYPTYSAADVHDGITLEQDPDAFRGKIVLIGATSLSLQDIYPTPFSATSPTPGVEIVANTIDTILNGKFMTYAPPWMTFLIILAAAGLALLITLSRRPSLTLILLGAVMLAYLVTAFVLFANERYILPTIAPLAMLFLGVILPTLEQAVSQEQEKRRVRNLFSRFISPEMVDQMMKTQDLNSVNKRADLTIIFTDIRGFTTLSEKLTPEGVVSLLNPYLEAMSQVIYKHGGTVDKYEGDAIIAFFGEPVPYKDHAARALRASLDMRKSLAELRDKWTKEGRPSQIEMGVGINSGEVFVGLLGSAQRINYTVIGDNANLAARLQDLTKTYAWPILISESTYQQVKDEFDCELADAVVVKGKTKAVNVYKVVGEKGAPESEKLKAWTSEQVKPTHEG
ncbi:MAG: adenylate/guanylate cyclase domain-containing protein [Anaerolineae bacterium]|nr:adenylate/guanylate cyclase domain-containing protein [Anaerolineae bacterium]